MNRVKSSCGPTRKTQLERASVHPWVPTRICMKFTGYRLSIDQRAAAFRSMTTCFPVTLCSHVKTCLIPRASINKPMRFSKRSRPLRIPLFFTLRDWFRSCDCICRVAVEQALPNWISCWCGRTSELSFCSLYVCETSQVKRSKMLWVRPVRSSECNRRSGSCTVYSRSHSGAYRPHICRTLHIMYVPGR